ncbi:EamA family transporter [Ornithinimicrobium sp. INDO-MA30-4]|uniref:EamA family transporter n=1 Tax=Ornithinimicrobium sp. INDO-MA30-4 TaxID=2908651 RepID=UPI001F1A63FC|nr:EamA family transporter [Ornithinimicrobium sp. INDO-MA30-4]UJH69490.1 EamA family transporter [Ornithinimicrobium sp. INDO-MA30-4]
MGCRRHWHHRGDLSHGRLWWAALGLDQPGLELCHLWLGEKKVGNSLSALQSLTAETIVIAPAAAIAIAVLAQQGNLTFGNEGWVHALLLAGAGVATTVPLLLFAGAARRVPLTTIGLLQFITPVAQLLTAVFLLGETMEPSRWVGFAMVWVALAVLSADSLVSVGRSRRLARAARGMAA